MEWDIEQGTYMLALANNNDITLQITSPTKYRSEARFVLKAVDFKQAPKIL